MNAGHVYFGSRFSEHFPFIVAKGGWVQFVMEEPVTGFLTWWLDQGTEHENRTRAVHPRSPRPTKLQPPKVQQPAQTALLAGNQVFKHKMSLWGTFQTQSMAAEDLIEVGSGSQKSKETKIKVG